MTSENSAVESSWESLNDCPLRLRIGLRFRSEGPGNDWTCFLEDSISGRSFAMSHWQRWFLELIESRTPAQDAARLVIACHPDQVSRDTVVRFVDWLIGEKLLEKIATIGIEPGIPEERAPELASRTGLRLVQLRPQIWHFSMNAVAVLLIALGAWMLKPPAQISPGQAKLAIRSFSRESTVHGESEFEPGQIVPVRVASAGILAEVLVGDGDEVDEGDLIARIDDPIELHLLLDLKHQLGECRVRRDRSYLAANRENYTMELRRIAGLSRQIGIHQARATLAELRAPVGGLVETGVLCSQIGGEVARGDVLLTVHAAESDAPDSELLAGNP